MGTEEEKMKKDAKKGKVMIKHDEAKMKRLADRKIKKCTCLNAAGYWVVGLCEGKPRLSSGAHYKHCMDCEGLGKCVGHYAIGHCKTCGKHEIGTVDFCGECKSNRTLSMGGGHESIMNK